MILIVGAGPAGCYAAFLLARKGRKVKVLEEHPKVGSPVQCTGIVTPQILRFVEPIKGVVINKISKVRLHSAKQQFLFELSSQNLILNRAALDRQLADMARKAGADIQLSTKVTAIKSNQSGYSITTNKGRLKAKTIIGADGPLSTVAREMGMFRTPHFFNTKQLLVKKPNANIVGFFLLEKGIGWLVPVNRSTVRAGIATTGNPFTAFEEFSTRFSNGKVLATQGGLIPVFSPWGRRQKGNAFLIGDAGGFVKATTGGGLVQALYSALLCTRAILHGPAYDVLWPLKLASELSTHRVAFNVLQRKSPQGLDELVGKLSKKKGLLSSGSRDNFLLMALKLAITEPSLFKVLRKN